MNKQNKNGSINKKRLVIFVLVILFVLGIVIVLWFSQNSLRKPNNSTPNVTNENINLGPPTAEDKKRVESTKESIVKESQNNSDQAVDSSGRKTVKPVITYADVFDNNVEIGGYISGTAENGGNCQVTLSMGSRTITRNVTGVANNSVVSCPTVRIPVSDLAAGKWIAVISYSSGSSQGASDEKTVEIQ